jgi:hypothetical protein
MGVGAAADGDGIDAVVTEDVVDRGCNPSAGCRADLRCECRHGVIHRGQRSAGNTSSEKLCMHATDAPTSEDTDVHVVTIRFAGSASR